jgi:uroporphyrin-3 C-methyltransferase
MSEGTNPVSPKSSFHISWLAIVALVVALIACGGAGFVGFQAWQLQHASAMHQAQLSGLSDQLNAVQQAETQRQADLINRLDQLSAQVRQANGASDQVRLGSAIYLVRLANLALIINHDPVQAQQLLQQAQARLALLPEFSSLRSAIISARTQMMATSPVDLDGMLMRISALKSVIQTLSPLPKVPAAPKSKKTAAASNTASADWRTLWGALKSAFVVSHHGSKEKALPTIDHVQAVKDSVYVMLTSAQWALIRQDSTVYKSMMQDALAQLQTIKRVHPVVLKRLLTALKSLAHTSVSPSYPALGPLINRLNKAHAHVVGNDGIGSTQAASIPKQGKHTAPAQKHLSQQTPSTQGIMA